jgi:hypothetical protein
MDADTVRLIPTNNLNLKIVCEEMMINAFSRVMLHGLTIKVMNSPPCACHDSSGQKPQYGLMKLAYQRFTAVLLFIYGSLFLSGVYYCLSVFRCVVARMSKFLVKFGKSGSEIREMLV